MRVQIATLIVTVAMICCTAAFAQQTVPSTEKLKYHKWDAGGSAGILGTNKGQFGNQSGTGCYCGTEAWAWAGNIDFGRYITQHWKAEAGLMWTNQRHSYSYNYTYPQTFPVNSTSSLVRPVTISGAITYQFLENVFAHPYISAGIHVTSFSEESQTFVYDSNYATPPTYTSSSRKYTETKPFVAAGYKSYFNEHVYMRSEILAAFDKDGFSHGTARLGVGFDF